jgi:hypothetical protein
MEIYLENIPRFSISCLGGEKLQQFLRLLKGFALTGNIRGSIPLVEATVYTHLG